MGRNLRWVGISLLSTSIACFVDPGAVAGESDSQPSTGSGTTAMTSTTTTGSSSIGTTEGEATESPECDDDEGCGADEICVDGACEALVCESQAIVRGYLEPRVMLLVDKSRSMVTNMWDHDGVEDTEFQTRWKTLHTTLSELAVNEEANVDFGLKLFPDIGVPADYAAAACAVSSDPDLEVAPGMSASIGATLPSADANSMMTTIAGGTPASAAIAGATDHLLGLGDPERGRFILMITDGAANCRADAADDNVRFESYDDSVITSAQAAVAVGVEVGIVGLDISDEANPVQVDGKPDTIVPLAVVTTLATEGGLPPTGGEAFPNAVDAATLEAGLRGQLKQMRCTIVVPPLPGGATCSSLTLEGGQVPSLLGNDCAGDSGWVQLGAERARLCGEACSSYLDGAGLIVDYVCE